MKEYTIQELAEFINTINHATADAAIEVKQSVNGGAVGVLVGDNGFTVKITPLAHKIAEYANDTTDTDKTDGEV